MVQSLDQKDPLEKEMATHSNILAWRIPWTVEPGELQSMGWQRVRHHWATHTYTQAHWCWVSNILATWCKELTHWKRPWCWERLRAGERDDRGWMVGWHHRLDGHGFGWSPGVGNGQGGLACFGSWGPEELDTTEQLNWLRDYHTKWINQTEKDKLSLVCEIKIKKDPIELMKTQTDWETWKTNTEVTKVQGGRDKSGFGINTDTLLGIKQIPNKDLLHSTVNYTS